MTVTSDRSKSGRVRTRGTGAPFLVTFFLVLLLLVLPLFASGCASSSNAASDEQTRRVPPEVRDQSVEARGDDEVAVRPRVRVSMDVEQGSDLQTKGAVKFVRRDTRRCYRLALQKQRELQGTVVYEVIVTSNGRVGGVELVSSTAASERLEQCVEAVLHRLRFDVAEGRKAMVRRIYLRLELSREIFDPDRPPIESEPAKTSRLMSCITGSGQGGCESNL